MEMEVVLFIIFIAFLYWLALFIIPPLLIKRAIAQVITLFRAQRATEAGNAKTVDELGLSPGLLKSAVMRDYRPAALQLLKRAEVVRETLNDRIYLSEQRLKASCEMDRRNRLGFCDLADGQ